MVTRTEGQAPARKYWISWVQPTQDPKPIKYPPGGSVLGWWRTGFDDEGKITLVAWVECILAEQVRHIINEDWPELGDAEWRIFEEVDWDWRPSDRFPLSDWMEQRIK